ncbi:hypothetical protein [Chitinophaga arvensicola]|uniref:Lipocalin-like domain-containing protein n=1 Tax=Chitinophaga arvensicola TaxID=29529 RepID=A0A1I0Q7B9_9BACT|nr:hypothetical protein [Chitinophaga arvensicola]SEW22863.1 hypothetical protein SAMN04488122_1278 [Chitinophaga arvensicola]
MRILVTAMLSAIVFLGISCGKDKDNNDSRNRRFVSMKLDNRVYLAENPQGVLTLPNLSDENPDNDYPTMKITATTYNGDALTFTLAAPLAFTPGVYPATKKGNGMVVLLSSSYYSTLTSVGSTDFAITITSLDNTYVEGTFSGTLTDATGVGGPRVVKDGAFRAIITTQK